MHSILWKQKVHNCIHMSLPSVPILSHSHTTPHPTSLRSVLILFSHLHLHVLQVVSFHEVSPPNVGLVYQGINTVTRIVCMAEHHQKKENKIASILTLPRIFFK